jgi:hypothetical protein
MAVLFYLENAIAFLFVPCDAGGEGWTGLAAIADKSARQGLLFWLSWTHWEGAWALP